MEGCAVCGRPTVDGERCAEHLAATVPTTARFERAPSVVPSSSVAAGSGPLPAAARPEPVTEQRFVGIARQESEPAPAARPPSRPTDAPPVGATAAAELASVDIPDEDLVVTSQRRVALEPAPPARGRQTAVLPDRPALGRAEPAPPAPLSAPARPNSSIGRMLGGRFQVKSRLGAGAFGTTYVAWDNRLLRECVIKTLRPMSADPSALEIQLRKRFFNEALALAHLVHPNTTQVFDHGEEPDGTAWIAMEYVRGRSLADVGEAEGKLDGLRVARLGAQIASALAYAHRNGIVHRDLKPENILVVDDPSAGEQAKVLDFGLAHVADPQALGLSNSQAQLTAIGSILGTPAYMSPEQAEGAAVGPASDIYSLGVVLYLLVTGQLPGTVPERWNPLATIAYIRSPLTPVLNLRPDCPPSLARTIEAMLVKPVAARTITATQVEQELRAMTPGSSVIIAAAPARPRSRRRWWWPAGAGLVVVGAGLAVTLLLGRTKATAPAPVAVKTKPPAAAPDPSAALREAAIKQVLLDARAGKPAVLVDTEAEALLKGGADPRLWLARGLAHLGEHDYGSAAAYLDHAAQAKDPQVAQEAARQLVVAKAGEASAALMPLPKPKAPARAPVSRIRIPRERPEY